MQKWMTWSLESKMSLIDPLLLPLNPMMLLLDSIMLLLDAMVSL